LQELLGNPCIGTTLSTVLPATAAEELDGTERPLGEQLALRNNTLIMDFTPYELKTVLLKIPTTKSPPSTRPVTLDYDTDVFSYNTNREDGYGSREVIQGRDENVAGSSGSFDGKGATYPAERIGDTVSMGSVSFAIGPRDDGAFNAVACRGQHIDLPAGTRILHLLAAADVDTDVVFRAGDTDLPLVIGGWAGRIGQWDNRVFVGDVAELSYSLRNDLQGIAPAYVRDQRVAWYASHRHLPARDTLYDYGYLFAYRLEIPEGATRVTLPHSPFVRIVALSAGDEGHAVALQSSFEDLHRDDAFVARFAHLHTPDVNDE
jgi:alpha-mannosidase